jgi:hypothetical protein
MSMATKTDSNVQQAVPFLWVHDIERSVAFTSTALDSG